MRSLRYLLLAALLGALQGCLPVLSERYGIGHMEAADRRTAGVAIADERIESDVIARIGKQYPNTIHVNVTSFNRHVLITGAAPDEAARAGIEQAAASAPDAGAVINEIEVLKSGGVVSRGSDNAIASDVRLRFLNNGAFLPTHVKVIVENGAVFLMGLVYRKEADVAAEIASTTNRVQRVVKVFEYLD